MQRLQARKMIQKEMREEGEERFRYFPLEELLPTGDMLVVDMALQTIAQLRIEEGVPRVVAQQQFTNSEMSLVVPLLENYPHYCPHEVLFASFYNGSVTEKTIARARQRLQEALEYDTWDHEMRPIRNVISRVRANLREFGMDASSILETGYLLLPQREVFRPSAT